MNKSSSLLLHLHLHLLHLFIMNKSSNLKKKEKKKKRKKERLTGQGHWARTSQATFKKKKKFHQSNFFKFLQKFKISKFFKKKKIQNFQFLRKIQVFEIQKKKSSLNSSSGAESYDPLPHSPVMQHQVNCPPSVFIEAWSMSQTRGIRQVCQIIFNE